MNPLGASLLIVIILVVLLAPRRWALLGIFAGVLYLTQAQQISVAGFNMYAMRFIELAGFIRVMIRGEFSFTRLGRIDRTVLLLYIYSTIVYLLRSNEGQVYQIGIAVDALLCYFVFRGMVTDLEDLKWFLKSFVLLLGPFVVMVMIESFTGRNLFSALGIDDYFFRNGRVRSQGSFRHPSLMGTLGGSFLPLYIGLFMAKSSRILAVAGVGFCLAIVWASNSGGPAGCAVVAIIGWMLWGMRKQMHWVRRGFSVFIIVCGLVMKAPIWYLVAKFSAITGGDGWHRSYLMDMGYRHLSSWWLIGMPIADTSSWFPYNIAITGGSDITNNYLAFGLTAGLAALALLILLLTRSFRSLGKALAVVRRDQMKDDEVLLWGLGVVLMVHVLNWMDITYFDQSNVVWLLQISLIPTLAEKTLLLKQSFATNGTPDIRLHKGMGQPRRSPGLASRRTKRDVLA